MALDTSMIFADNRNIDFCTCESPDITQAELVIEGRVMAYTSSI